MNDAVGWKERNEGYSMREVEEERIDEESCFRGLEKVGNGISRARVEDKMAGTLGASKVSE